MKICVVIQSEAFLSSAGMRIRYDRFRDLGADKATIETATCANLFEAKSFEHDAYVFCKTFDITALLLARRLRAAGKVIGQDLFDDYFSQHSDSRLQRYRDWMRDMAPVTDYAICSTPKMVEVVRPYLPDIRITAVDDPVVNFDAASIAALSEQKTAKARITRSLDVVWFGIGDNPFFTVGLTDLAACEPQFALMERLGWKVRLRIVTNRRSFEGSRAEVLRRLSIGFEVIEWSEESEREALVGGTIAIIPVNGQSFSRAKSLNRALTALTAGCQVLSIGYPLYERLGELVYRSIEDLLSDLDAGTSRLGHGTVETLSTRLAELADPSRAASIFIDEARRAFDRLKRRSRPPGPVCIIHGRASTIGVHKGAGALGGFSVKTIFCVAAWNFPVRFDREHGEIVMRVTLQIAQKYSLPICPPGEVKRFGIFDLVTVDTARLGVEPLKVRLSHQPNPILDLAVYEDVMTFAGECCAAAFPGADVLISDSSIFTRKPARLVAPKFLTGSQRSLSRLGAVETQKLGSMKRERWLRSGKFWSLARVSKAQALEQASELLAGSSFFDPEWYLASYPDVAAAGLDPATHYLEFGWREGRNPSPWFSTKDYLKANKDVAGQGINPLLHYLEYGQIEGRSALLAVKGAGTP